MQQQRSDNAGFITLLGVLVVGAIGSAIAVSLILLGVDASRTSFANEQSQRARARANACAEHALNELRLSPNYAGNEDYSFSGQTCHIYPVQGSGITNRIVQTTGIDGSVIRKITVSIAQLQPAITLTSWQEIDF